MNSEGNKLATRLAKILSELAGVLEEIEGGAPPPPTKEALQEVSDRICLRCKKTYAPGARIKRGMHEACYQAANRLVGRGTTTWNKLILGGYALPDSAGGRPAERTPMDDFVEASHKAELDLLVTDAITAGETRSSPKPPAKKKSPARKRTS
jgi:hypothetical protein